MKHMKIWLVAATLAATLAGPVHANRDTLIRSITPELRLLQIPTEGLKDLRTVRIVQIKGVLDNNRVTRFTQRQRIKAVLRNAERERPNR
jgi:hypothetical protein